MTAPIASSLHMLVLALLREAGEPATPAQYEWAFDDGSSSRHSFEVRKPDDSQPWFIATSLRDLSDSDNYYNDSTVELTVDGEDVTPNGPVYAGQFIGAGPTDTERMRAPLYCRHGGLFEFDTVIEGGAYTYSSDIGHAGGVHTTARGMKYVRRVLGRLVVGQLKLVTSTQEQDNFEAPEVMDLLAVGLSQGYGGTGLTSLSVTIKGREVFTGLRAWTRSTELPRVDDVGAGAEVPPTRMAKGERIYGVQLGGSAVTTVLGVAGRVR